MRLIETGRGQNSGVGRTLATDCTEAGECSSRKSLGTGHHANLGSTAAAEKTSKFKDQTTPR